MESNVAPTGIKDITFAARFGLNGEFTVGGVTDLKSIAGILHKDGGGFVGSDGCSGGASGRISIETII